MRNRARRRLGLLSALSLGLAPLGVRAQEAVVTFAAPPGPLRSAATVFAVQAHVSIDLGAVGGCGPSKGFSGRATPDVALSAILAGTGCEARLIAPRAYQIRPRPADTRRAQTRADKAAKTDLRDFVIKGRKCLATRAGPMPLSR